MNQEQKLKALQAVLERGKMYTLPTILDAIKTIMGKDMLQWNSLQSLYDGGSILVSFAEKREEAIRFAFYIPPDIPNDGLPLDKTKVMIRKIEIA